MPAGALQAAAPHAERFRPMTYEEFWPRYLAGHADRRTRALHYLATAGALACIPAAAIAADWRWGIAAPVVGYAAAWLGHAAFEPHRPRSLSPSDLVAGERFPLARPLSRRPDRRGMAPPRHRKLIRGDNACRTA